MPYDKKKGKNGIQLILLIHLFLKIGLKPGHFSNCSIMNNGYVRDDSGFITAKSRSSAYMLILWRFLPMRMPPPSLVIWSWGQNKQHTAKRASLPTVFSIIWGLLTFSFLTTEEKRLLHKKNNTSTLFGGGDKYINWVSMVCKKNPGLSLLKCTSLVILQKVFTVSVEKKLQLVSTNLYLLQLKWIVFLS